MRTLKLALLTTVAFAGVGSAAYAADLIIDTPAPVMMDYSAGHSWDGPYIGLYFSGQTDSIYSLGANLGVNAMIDENLLVGVEGDVAWLSDDSWQGQVHGKLGFAADSIAFYGLLGLGYNSDTEAYAPIGVGVEFAMTEELSLKAEYQYQYDFSSSADDAHVAKVGLNWHF
ncbi:outer membrane protein [Devosia sp.]|uniref:outer membrane protein n=1 Tax=Devosia sp. TaxID=1871048 RepID=UPI003A941CF6